MLDVEVPDGALEPDAERALLAELTDVLLRWEGADPANPAARALAWVYLHRPAALFVAGEPAARPHYRITASVPEGQFDDERRAGIVPVITDAVLRAERGRHDHDPSRVWVLCREVPDGTWGGAGRIVRLGDIAGTVLGSRTAGARYAAERLGRRRATAG